VSAYSALGSSQIAIARSKQAIASSTEAAAEAAMPARADHCAAVFRAVGSPAATTAQCLATSTISPAAAGFRSASDVAAERCSPRRLSWDVLS
jgi:hypothetical protein